MKVGVQTVVFWDVKSCRLIGGYQHFGGTHFFVFRTSSVNVARVYFRETGNTINMRRCKEYAQHICLFQPHKFVNQIRTSYPFKHITELAKITQQKDLLV
jgi:hypothetical protein